MGDGRPSGSGIKPFIYAKAVQEKKLTLRDTFLNGPLGEGYFYKPGNYGSYTNKLVSFEDAIVGSLNNGAVIAAKKAGGVRPIANFLKKVGLPQPEDANETMFLGSTNASPLAVANAYRIFVPEFGGKYSRFHFVRRITDEHGKTLYHFQPKASEVNVISQETAITITHALQEAVERGTGQAANGVFEFVAGKSGSSHDAWFTGYTPRLVVTVWIGFDDFRNLDHFTGGQLAAPIWKEFMLRLKQSRPEYFEGTFLQPTPTASPSPSMAPTASPSTTPVHSPTLVAPEQERQEPITQPSPSPSPVATRPRIAVVAPAEN
jgi:membrane peptidoglycan carboxypeptidase